MPSAVATSPRDNTAAARTRKAVSKVLHANTRRPPLRVAIVGVNAGQPGAFRHVRAALDAAAVALGLEGRLAVIGVEARAPAEAVLAALAHVRPHAVVVTGGYGAQGMEGKLATLRFAREAPTPCLALCQGMQLMAVECARSMLGWRRAHTAEAGGEQEGVHVVVPLAHPSAGKASLRWDPTQNLERGGSAAAAAYSARGEGGGGEEERVRHAFAVAASAVTALCTPEGGLCAPAHFADSGEVALLEFREHPFYVGAQFHPEERGAQPHPLFIALLRAAATGVTRR